MIYVCIPAHNEALTLGPLLWKVRRVFREFGREFHLVVLDDASSDETREVLERYEGQLPLTVIREGRRIGYGAAVTRLLKEAVKLSSYPKRDAAVVLQADMTEDPADLVALVKTMEGGADVVAGATAQFGPEVPKPFRWGRRLAPLVLGRAYRNAPVEDPLCGLRAYRVIVLKKALRDADGPLSSAEEPWVANLEILQGITGYARRVETLPLEIRYGLLNRGSRFRTTHTLKRLFGLRSRRWPELASLGKKPSRADEQAA